MSPLSRPPADLTTFPARRVRADRELFRIHRQERGPWWFSADGSGRFDLAAPRGTCYLAEDAIGAFVEVFREIGQVAQRDVDRRRLSVLRLPRLARLADCTGRSARGFGITAAIHAGERYDLTPSWAEALADAGFDGVRYRVSHDPAQRAIGIALFGPAGQADYPTMATLPIGPALLDDVWRQFRIRVLPSPQV